MTEPRRVDPSSKDAGSGARGNANKLDATIAITPGAVQASLEATIDIEGDALTASASGITAHGPTVPATDSGATTEVIPGPRPDQTILHEGAGEGTDFSLDDGSAKIATTEGGPRPDGVHVPGYRIVGELGRGGMGVVYKAMQVGLNRWVALKMILAGVHAGTQQLARFKLEAEAVGHLHHPNIVQVYEIGDHDGLPFFSLEFVDGPCLANKIYRQPQPPREAARMIETLARAMDYAHVQGVIHRDLKPANVLLTSDGVPKITDFGLAKRLESDSSNTKSGTLMGTPSYMSPEQARGEVHTVGPLSDVYSLGAMLYELLTGRPPFEAATIMETVVQVTRDEPVPPARLQPSVPKDLETICLKCLQKELGKRYESALELAEDLQRYLSDEPIKARPVSAPERLVRWCRRNPRVALLVGTVAVLLMVVTFGSLGAAYKISQEKAETETQRNMAEEQRNKAEENADKAQQAQKLAGEQAQLALNTIYDVVTKADEKLQSRAEMGPLRKELLELVMKRLDKISKDAVTSGKADRTMGLALQRMGQFYNSMGKTNEEIEVHKRSLEIFERLMQEDAREDWNPFNAAISHDNLGEIGREIEPDPAKLFDHYEKALQLRRNLVSNINKPEPSLFRRKQVLASSYQRLAILALVVGDPIKARNYAREAVNQSEACVPQSAEEVQLHKEQMSNCHFALGRASSRAGDETEARNSFRRCLELREEWMKTDKANALAKQEFGRAVAAVGDMELDLGHGAAALVSHGKARDLFEGMAKKDPGNPEIQWYLANAQYALANSLRFTGDKTTAENLQRACLKTRESLLKEDPKNPQRKIELMLVQARLGMAKEASKIAADVQTNAPHHPGMLLAVACCYSWCKQTAMDPQEKRLYGEKAEVALRQAIDQGYKDVRGLQSDPDTEPLRGNPVFQQVLGKLARK